MADDDVLAELEREGKEFDKVSLTTPHRHTPISSYIADSSQDAEIERTISSTPTQCRTNHLTNKTRYPQRLR